MFDSFPLASFWALEKLGICASFCPCSPFSLCFEVIATEWARTMGARKWDHVPFASLAVHYSCIANLVKRLFLPPWFRSVTTCASISPSHSYRFLAKFCVNWSNSSQRVVIAARFEMKAHDGDFEPRITSSTRALGWNRYVSLFPNYFSLNRKQDFRTRRKFSLSSASLKLKGRSESERERNSNDFIIMNELGSQRKADFHLRFCIVDVDTEIGKLARPYQCK